MDGVAQMKRKAARILDEVGVSMGAVHVSKNGITVHNYNNNKNTVLVDWDGKIRYMYKTPRVADLLKIRARREFVIID